MANVTTLNVADIISNAFGAQDRALEPTPISEMEHVHEEMVFYGIQPGEIVRFMPSYDEVYTQKISTDPNRKGVQYLVPVQREMNGVKTESLFNLNVLNKRDARNNYVHTEIVKEGALPKRLALLCKWGEIIGENEVTIDVAAFDNQTGKREKADVTIDGKVYSQNKIKKGTYVPIKQYVKNA